MTHDPRPSSRSNPQDTRLRHLDPAQPSHIIHCRDDEADDEARQDPRPGNAHPFLRFGDLADGEVGSRHTDQAAIYRPREQRCRRKSPGRERSGSPAPLPTRDSTGDGGAAPRPSRSRTRAIGNWPVKDSRRGSQRKCHFVQLPNRDETHPYEQGDRGDDEFASSPQILRPGGDPASASPNAPRPAALDCERSIIANTRVMIAKA